MRIFGWAASIEDGCFRYRIEMPLEAARLAGHEVHYSNAMPDEWRDADVLIGQRVCQPKPSVRWLTHAKTPLNRCVFEVDDDLLKVDPSSAAYQAFADPLVKKCLVRNIQAAQVVTVSTTALAERIGPANPNTHVVPNAVPDWLPELQRSRANRVTVGWTASSAHVMDWSDHSGQILRVLRRHPEADLHTIGGNYLGRAAPANHRHTRWVHGLDVYYRTIDFDIGIAPLRRDHEFNTAKSALKALEYAALGIPVVASAVRPYEEFVRHGETGFLVRHEHEWSRYLHMLLSDEAMRAEIGRKARDHARQFTISRVLPLWVRAWAGEQP